MSFFINKKKYFFYKPLLSASFKKYYVKLKQAVSTLLYLGKIVYFFEMSQNIHILTRKNFLFLYSLYFLKVLQPHVLCCKTFAQSSFIKFIKFFFKLTFVNLKINQNSLILVGQTYPYLIFVFNLKDLKF